MSIALFIGISIVIFFSSLISTMSLIPSLIVLIISLFIFIFFTNKLLNRYFLITKRFHSCYRFINNFIISLSVKNTVGAALLSIHDSMDEEYKKEISELEHLSDNEKLEYLKKFYRFHIYELFVDVVNLFVEQGGNILNMSKEIIERSRYIEEYLNASHTIGMRKIIEFSTLWIFSILILLVLRLVLGDFYSLIASKLFFQIIVAVLLIFIAFSIHLMVSKFTNIKIGGWSYEKV